MKNSILQNIKQVLLIVFSVVLGILLSEKIDERKNEKEAALILSKLKSEINENQKLLEEWVPYHSEIVRSLDTLNNDETFIQNFIEDESALFERVLHKGNLMSDFPSSDAWDIAKSHPLIVHFEYEELLNLSKIYNQLKMTYEPVPKLIELFLSSEFNSEENAKLNLESFRIQLREITTREIQLMGYIKEAEEILDLKNN